MTDPIRVTPGVIIQTASFLPQSDDGWNNAPWLIWEGGTEDVGATLGSAILQQDFGNRTSPNGSRFGYVPDPEMGETLAGQFVRILMQDDDGDIEINGDTYTAFWWGVINDPDSQPDGAEENTAGTTRWNAVSIASVLDQIQIDHGLVLSSDDNVSTIGYCPIFNGVPRGDRSADQFGGGYVHDFTTFLGTGNYWLAFDVVTTLLVNFANPSIGPDYIPVGLNWVLSDPDNCLQYVVSELDLNGKTILQALNEIISEARGLTWWTTVGSDGTCTITVQSTGTVSVVCPTPPVGPTYTYPAASQTATYDITGQGFLDAVRIRWDWSQVYDQIVIFGAHPWVGLTVDYSQNPVALKGASYGWTTGDESEWSPPTGNVLASGTEAVWRRFMFDPAWVGTNYQGGTTSGLRNSLITADDSSLGNTDIFGANGFTGERKFDPSDDGIPPSLMLKTERMLPCSMGFGDDRLNERQPPCVFIQLEDIWSDVSQQYGVEMQDGPPCVRIDDGANGVSNKATVDNNLTILATIGVREIEPLKVSWCQDPAQRVNGSPRIKRIDMPQCEQWIVLKGTVTGASIPDGVLQTLSEDLIVRDDTVWLQAALALAIPWFTVPACLVQITDRGNLDISPTYRSGVVLTSLTRGDGDCAVNSVIHRSWTINRTLVNGSDMVSYSTQYATRRTPPDVGTIIGAHIG